MDDQNERDASFKVSDRRKFNEGGDLRPDADQAPPEETATIQGGREQARPEATPPATLSMLVLSLATNASLSLGDVPTEDGKVHLDLPGAKYMIDLLLVLQEKTRGNQTPDEERLLRDVLTQLQLRFVDVSQKQRPK